MKSMGGVTSYEIFGYKLIIAKIFTYNVGGVCS